MNEILETLFMNFLESRHTGPLAAELHRCSESLDRAIAAGDADDAAADYECAAMRYGFLGGYVAAMEVMGRAVEV